MKITAINGLSGVLGLGALAGLPADARAEYPDGAGYFGVQGGYHLVLRDWQFGDDPQEMDSSPDVGIRLGWQINRRWALEGDVAWLPVDGTTLFAYDVDVLYHLTGGDWAPYAVAGLGAYNGFGGDRGTDVDPQGSLGLGLRGLLAPWVALRLQARDMFSDGDDTLGAQNLEFTLGFDFFFCRHKETPPPPPVVAAPPPPPDKDGDGIVDAEDKCPEVAGTAALNGCPDKDGDGLTDALDKCPEVAGTAALNGCPDKDGDGIVDAEDKCPEAAGPAALKGCPDKDGDGIADVDDKCPEQAGLPAEQGCLPAAMAKFSGTIKGINFASSKAEIQPDSRKLLDEAVAALTASPTLRLRIEGHTDTSGRADFNRKLSQDRADAVKKYLVSKGIDAGRLDAAGFGGDKPLQDNTTPEGRAVNRRIEFVVLTP